MSENMNLGKLVKESFVRENRFTKAIAISPDNLVWIKEIKGKKSAAGKLNEIIEFYKTNYKPTPKSE